MEPREVAALWESNAETWTRHARMGYDVYRDALNTPAFLEILPPIDGLNGLDVGCGEGANTRQLARRGARMTAIDIAPTFTRNAQEAESAEPLGIRYQVADGMALPFRDESFNFVTAFMSLMDMPDPGLAIREAARVTAPGGFLQFSILHPCFSPPHRRVLRDAVGRTTGVELGRYFDRVDGELDTWHFHTAPAEERAKVAPFRTPRFHRTLSQWVDFLIAANLAIEKLSEPSASAEVAAQVHEVEDTRVVPLFLHVRARKPT
jgi:ubiquinone/menaquinone biosynthesis C-methylase UbiE